MFLGTKELTLHEAADITGYSSDYIGSLIRGGKIPGRRLVGTSAWTTPEAAVLEYCRENKGGHIRSKRAEALKQYERARTAEKRLRSPSSILNFVSVALLASSIVASLYLLQMFFVIHEKKVERAAQLDLSAHNVAGLASYDH